MLLAIAKMKRGETAVVTATSPYGYGDAAFQAPKAAVPPASTLQYTITLKVRALVTCALSGTVLACWLVRVLPHVQLGSEVALLLLCSVEVLEVTG